MAKYKYVNTITGASFETDVVCGGGPWKQIDNATPEPENEQEEATKKGKKESK